MNRRPRSVSEVRLHDDATGTSWHPFASEPPPDHLDWSCTIPDGVDAFGRLRTLVLCDTTARVLSLYFGCPTAVHLSPDLRALADAHRLDRVTHAADRPHPELATGVPPDLRPSAIHLNPVEVARDEPEGWHASSGHASGHTVRQVRAAHLGVHYRSDGPVAVREWMRRVVRFDRRAVRFREAVDRALATRQHRDAGERATENVLRVLDRAREETHRALCDDLQFAGVLEAVERVVEAVLGNVPDDGSPDDRSPDDGIPDGLSFVTLLRLRTFVVGTLDLLGLDFRPDGEVEDAHAFFWNAVARRVLDQWSHLELEEREVAALVRSPRTRLLANEVLLPFFLDEVMRFANPSTFPRPTGLGPAIREMVLRLRRTVYRFLEAAPSDDE